MRLLFFTRKFPPQVGGMEKLSYGLSKEFGKHADTTLITWGHSQKFLPVFIPFAFLRALFIIPLKKIDHVHLGDALLAPLGLILKKLYGVKVSVTVMGLDIVYDFPVYRFIIPGSVALLDKVICISQATKSECVKRGVLEKKCVVITPGVYPEEFQTKASRHDLEKIVKKDLSGKKVLITVGRLVKRKGVYWFIDKVLPKLNSNIIYLVIGDGTEKDLIEISINKNNLSDRVFLLGKIRDEDLRIIYNTSDLFVMPNIKVSGNMEGFGIVAVEASSVGLPLVASDIEGIQDSVINNKTGILAKSLDSQSFIKAIDSALKLKKSEIIKTSVENFSWPKIGKKYVKNII